MSDCAAELCGNWTGDGCACAVLDLEPTCGPCECDWKTCGHKGRTVPAADHGPIRTNPELCIACLYGCEADREEEMDRG